MTETHRDGAVLVTGASSGIGLATALALAERGTTTVLVGRDPASLERAAAACAERGAPGIVAVADVRDAEAVAAAFDTAAAQPGGLRGVVHAAAVLAYGDFVEVPAEVFESTVDTVLLGTARVCREALSRFRAGTGGSLVVVGSLLGKTTTPGMSSYTTSKWGVHGLVRTLQQETRTDPDIAISLVSPGGVDTPIYQQAGTYLGRHGQPPPPVSSPEAVAAAVLRCLERPRREVDVGPANGLVARGFRLVPSVYDWLVAPLMSRLALQPGSGLAPTPGNVFAPVQRLDRLTGGWLGFRPAGPGKDSTMEHPTAGSPGQPRRRTIAASADRVWEVLADGWSYSTWVVGTARIRAVDVNWPEVGSQIHHSVGAWPALLSDTTEVLEAVPGRRLLLKARGWPLGEAHVHLELEPDGADACTVTMVEDAVSGPGRLTPKPLRQMVILPRNGESLRRLALLAERRTG